MCVSVCVSVSVSVCVCFHEFHKQLNNMRTSKK